MKHADFGKHMRRLGWLEALSASHEALCSELDRAGSKTALALAVSKRIGALRVQMPEATNEGKDT